MSTFSEHLKSLWNYQDPAATEKKFRELLPASKSNPAHQAELLSQIARTHSLRHQFTEAHATLDEAESLLTPDMSLPRIRCLLERGRTHNSASQPKTALPLFESAFTLAEKHHFDFHAADAAHMIAIAHPDPAEQLRWNFKTIELAESSNDESTKPWIGTSYNNIGWTYHAQGDYPQSLKWLEKARDYYDSPANKNEKYKFIAHWAVAKLLRLNNRCDEALVIQKKLESNMLAKNDIDGFVFEELAELNLLQNDLNTARNYFRKAHESLHQIAWLVASEPARLKRIENLATNPSSPV